MRTILIALILLSAHGMSIASENWDTTKSYGVTRDIEFDTDEGTNTSVDMSADGQWLAFDLLGNIYRVPSDGGTAELLTRNAGQAVNYHPRYSPNGRFIAFISDRGGQNNLWLMAADGSNPRPIVLDLQTRFAQPTWTPDGKFIVVQRIFGVPGEGMERRILHLWIYSVETGEGHELTGKQDSQTSWPSVSADGRYVYFDNSIFGSEEYTAYHLERLELSSGEIHSITPAQTTFRAPTFRVSRMPEFRPADSFAPEVSPDGHYLAFARRILGGESTIRGHAFNYRTALWLRDLRTGIERVLMDPIDPDRTGVYARGVLRVVNGYCWTRDSSALIVPVNGKLRRVEVSSGRVNTIPFRVHVHRRVSQMAQSHIDLSGNDFPVRFVESAATSPDGKSVVFYGAGQLWIRDRGKSVPRPLAIMEDRVQMMPAWSPDGRWIAFICWKDGENGSLWKISVDGGDPRMLTTVTGEYLYPTWSPDGKQIAVVSGSQETLRGDSISANPYWYLSIVPSDGGAPVVKKQLPSLTPIHWVSDERIYFLDTADQVEALNARVQGGALDANSKVLTSVDPRGQDIRRHVIFSPLADDALISPDGRHVAYHSWFDVYLADIPRTASIPLIDFYAPGNVGNVRRLSTEGGWFPRWQSSGVVEYLNGTHHYFYNLENGIQSDEPIDLKVPRGYAHGSIALVGATILPMVPAGVGREGSIVVTDGRIRCVFDCDLKSVDRIIDARGKYILPGFVDVHHHNHQSRRMPEMASRHHPHSALLLAYGVTTAVNPYGIPTVDPHYADLSMSGRVVGPRYFHASFGIHDNHPEEHIETYADAVRTVNLHANTGAIGIKNFHLTNRRQSQMLSVATQRHGGLYLTAEQGDLDYVLGLVLDGHTGWEHMLEYDTLHRDVTQFFGRAGVTYSPTLIVGGLQFWGSEYFLPRDQPWRDPKYTRFMPWQWMRTFPSFGQRPPSDFSFSFMAEGVASIVRAGGNAAIGAHGEVPGMGDHWEMQIYANALGTTEVLTMATIGGARFVGADRDVGSLEPGKLGDLIVLNSDPRRDIKNTLDLQYVMKGGVLFDASTLDETWPETIQFEPVPWKRTFEMGPRSRSLDHWDHNPSHR